MNIFTKFGIACVALAAVCLASTNAQAQCTTCAVPQTTFSPVVQPAMQPMVVNNYTTYDGWYLGKFLGRASRRLFGTAPAPAYQAAYPATYAAAYPTTYAAAYPTTYAASYAPAVSYAASYAPACSTCSSSPCCCAQTTYRPVVMQAVAECNTCDLCGTSTGVTQAGYNAPASSSCPTCNTNTYVQSPAESAAPSLPSNSPQPPQTFRETDRLDPVPAEESSVEDANADWNAPMLLDPNDKITKRPTAPVWTAVYKKQATITSISATERPATQPKQSIGWTSGR